MSHDTPCPRCGGSNETSQSYCRTCMSAYKKARRQSLQPTISCSICAEPFVKTRSRQLYCSEPCKRESHNLAHRVQAAAGTCVECGHAFEGRSDKQFCSKQCAYAAWIDQADNRRLRNIQRHNRALVARANRAPRAEAKATYQTLWVRKNRFRVAANAERYRAERHNVTVVTFTFEELRLRFSMWNMQCWMCGGSATAIDHVKPLTAGGSHMLANLRPACARCNSSKGGRWFGASKMSLFMRA